MPESTCREGPVLIHFVVSVSSDQNQHGEDESLPTSQCSRGDVLRCWKACLLIGCVLVGILSGEGGLYFSCH